MDFSPIVFPNPSIAKALQAADPSMSRHCLTRLSFGAGLTERMTSFTDGWSVNHMRPKFSGTCYELQGFEIPARVGRGREAKHDVDHIQLQDNNSPTSSEQTAPDCRNVGSKRKACKDLTNTSPVKKSKGHETTAKCPRTENASKEMSSTSDRSANLDSAKESSTKPQEPPKDYIHVRARRGQATDSHSLAERVRREKISERMKFLQALVPGCSKVTGKAVMLEEIINYVQSLQRQIEFLSVKLAAVDPSNIENLLDTELAAQATRSPETTLLGPDPLASHQEYQLRMQFQPQINDQCNMDLRSYLGRSTNAPVQLPPQMAYIDNFEGSLPQTLTGVYDGDLQTIVQMGSTQSRQDFFGQGLDGPSFISPGFLKVEY